MSRSMNSRRGSRPRCVRKARPAPAPSHLRHQVHEARAFAALADGINSPDAAIPLILDHADAKVLIADKEFSKPMKEALGLLKGRKPLVVDYDDPEFPVEGERLSHLEYEDFIAKGDPLFTWSLPRDEWDAISLN